MTDHVDFANALEAAADEIRLKDRLPKGARHPHLPARVMGILISDALSNVCAQRGLDFTQVFDAYMRVGRNVGIIFDQGPRRAAIGHLRDVAAKFAE